MAARPASRQPADWGVPRGRGVRITVDAQRSVEGLPGVFAIGDVSIGPDELPQLAQPALQGGKYVAALIADELRGKQRKPFVYSDKGTMATIGRASAVAQIKGLPRLKDFPAWAIWVGLHVVRLLGNRNRFATMISLTAKYLPWGNHDAIVGETPDVVALKPTTIEGAGARSTLKHPSSQRQPRG